MIERNHIKKKKNLVGVGGGNRTIMSGIALQFLSDV